MPGSSSLRQDATTVSASKERLIIDHDPRKDETYPVLEKVFPDWPPLPIGHDDTPMSPYATNTFDFGGVFDGRPGSYNEPSLLGAPTEISDPPSLTFTDVSTESRRSGRSLASPSNLGRPASDLDLDFGKAHGGFPTTQQIQSTATKLKSDLVRDKWLTDSRSDFPTLSNAYIGDQLLLQDFPWSRSAFIVQSDHLTPDDTDFNRGLCPYPTCGRQFKDLKAHVATHQNERPEKCPLPECEYHTKGFARKHDQKRHILTHFKGLIGCDFCSGQRLYNRVDLFKRHLTSQHGVEQIPPNARRKSPATSKVSTTSKVTVALGKCSICSLAFDNAQDLYEHLDDCVLHVIKQEFPEQLFSPQDEEPAQETATNTTTTEQSGTSLANSTEPPANITEGLIEKDQNELKQSSTALPQDPVPVEPTIAQHVENPKMIPHEHRQNGSTAKSEGNTSSRRSTRSRISSLFGRP